eukprot:93542_1
MSQSDSGKKAALVLLAVNSIGSLCFLCHYFGIKRKLAQNISRYVLSVFMILAGYAHFDAKLMSFYMNIMPPILPYKEQLILLSGAFEMLGGVLSLFGRTQTIGGYLTMATLICIFPANLYMAISTESQQNIGATQAQAYARLPLQIIMILMAYIYTINNQPKDNKID